MIQGGDPTGTVQVVSLFGVENSKMNMHQMLYLTNLGFWPWKMQVQIQMEVSFFITTVPIYWLNGRHTILVM